VSNTTTGPTSTASRTAAPSTPTTTWSTSSSRHITSELTSPEGEKSNPASECQSAKLTGIFICQAGVAGPAFHGSELVRELLAAHKATASRGGQRLYGFSAGPNWTCQGGGGKRRFRPYGTDCGRFLPPPFSSKRR